MSIRRVFVTAWAMLRQRFWVLAGMWAAFFAIQTAASVVLGIAGMAAGAAGAASFGAALEDPAALAGMGIGMLAFMVLFYGAYLVTLLAQQAAMVTLASPLEEPDFGAALARGFRSALPFGAITLGLGLGYAALAAVTSAVAAAAAGPVGALLTLPVLPAMVWLGCRLAVLIPVVAVDRAYNPMAAIRRCWAVTRGKAGAILLALLGLGGVMLALFGLPLALLIAVLVAAQDKLFWTIAVVIIGALLFLPVLLGFTLYVSAFIAALHAEVTDGGAEALEEVFA
mgnify:FL=1